MSGNPKAVPFHGILALGNTKDEAVNQYRLLALGKGASAFTDRNKSLSFVTSVSNADSLAEMFNPISGDMDLEKSEEILKGLEFESKSGDVEVFHYVCASGCGGHIVYDSENLVKFCPVCTAAIASDEDTDDSEDEDTSDDADTDSDDTSDDTSDEDADEDTSDDSDEDTSESSDDSDADDSDADDSDADDSDADDSDDADSDDSDADDTSESSADDVNDSADADSAEDSDGSDGEDDSDADDEDSEDSDADEDDSDQPLVIAASSKAKALEVYRKNRIGTAVAAASDNNLTVEYKVCSSTEECGAHVLSEISTLTKCPACDAALIEPKSMSSDDSDADTDDSEEDDDSDLQVLNDEDSGDECDSEEGCEEDGDDAGGRDAEDQSESSNHVDVSVLSQIDDSAEDAHAHLDLSYSACIDGAARWTAYYKGQPVAIASTDTVGKNVDIFHEPTFGNAVIAGSKHVGVKNILNEMGFKPIVHSIAISKVVDRMVSEQVTAAEEQIAKEKKEYSERLLAAMATAAIGINRGFFANIKNPLKEALWNAMSAAGIKQPEVLIHTAFKASADLYHNTLFSKASEIMSNPADVQESLAKAVLGTNYMGSESSTSSDLSTEDRLAGMGTSVSNSSQSTEVREVPPISVSSSQKIASVVSSLGHRGR